ncbi:hypothetical protein V1508DRAFT_232613 [Lipomyces doorenjongii]|uniref:uncharacterized protein n=1 Tax=Lipomyces doorenjongii TaxID=383834 RepID=UPI0034CEE87B
MDADRIACDTDAAARFIFHEDQESYQHGFGLIRDDGPVSEDKKESCDADGQCCDHDDDCRSEDASDSCRGCGGPCCGDQECCSDKNEDCCDADDKDCDDDEGYFKRDQDDCCEGDGACCVEQDEKDHAEGNDNYKRPDEKEQVQSSIVPTKCCGSDDDAQSLCSSSDTELVTCCLSGLDGPVKHQVLRFRPTRGKKKENCSCDEQCVDRFAKALCEKECHNETGDICATHESISNHYSYFLAEKREILWRCICTLMEQLEISASCCRDNSGTFSTGRQYSSRSANSVISHGYQRLGRLHDSQVQRTHGQLDHHNRRLHHPSQDNDLHHIKEEASNFRTGHNVPCDDPERALVLEKLSLSIKGMTCSSCEKKAARSLDKVMGVASASVSFLFEKGQVEYYPTLITPKQICADLQHMTGFKATILRRADEAFHFISGKCCDGDGVEMLPDNTWKVVYDPGRVSARDKMTALRLEISHILPILSSDEEASRKIFGVTIDDEAKQLYGSFLVALLLTIPILVLSWGSFKASMDMTRTIVCFVLATIVQIVCARKIYVSVYYTLVHGYDLDSDCLVALSTSVAYLYSLIVFALHRHGMLLDEQEIFESSSLLLTFVLFGKMVIEFIRRVAADQVKFDIVQPTTMKLQQFDNEVIPASLLHYGDRVVLDAGDQAVTDGIIVSGQGEFQESHINGESLPVLKKRGQEVLSGAKLVSGSVVFRATRLVPENSVSNIKLLVDSVTSFRTRSSDIVELVAKYLIPVMLCVSCVVFMIWTLVSTRVRHQGAGKAIPTAITYAIATLAVSCPCALVLVIPLVLSMGVAAGKRSYGVLLKSANPTTIASKIGHVVFDKTGTLTTDQLSVQYCWFNEMTEYAVRDIIRAIVSANNHPISRAVSNYLIKFGDTLAIVGETENIVGSGMATTYRQENGKSITILCGKPSFVGISPTDSRVAQLHDSGFTLFCVGVKNGATLAIMGITSMIREDCRPVLDALRARSITIHVLSGDTRPAVEKLCRDLGISRYAAETSPEGKNEYIEALKSSGSKVLFCGDGTNDAIALAQADIGLSMTKEGITVAAADACVLNNELSGVIKLLDLSKQINRRVIVGIIWVCVYNLFAVLAVSGAFVNVRIGPAWAGVSEVISILPVIAIALSMKWTGWRK